MPIPPNQFFLDGRRVVLRHGQKTQTINICTSTNEVGTYQERWRLAAKPAVEVTDLARFADLAGLRDWLRSRNARLEGLRTPGSAATPGARLPVLVTAEDIDQQWLAAARAATERAVDDLVDEFAANPYLHRVEHSLHARLFELLKRDLDGQYRLSTGELTQLVHKEWPETRPWRRGRGSFDLAVLAPSQVERATLEHFRSGRIEAPIVLELGLDYPLKHLQTDLHKLIHSRVPMPYLVHLSRVSVPEIQLAATEDLARDPDAGVQIAYVHHDPKARRVRVKHLHDEDYWQRVIRALPQQRRSQHEQAERVSRDDDE